MAALPPADLVALPYPSLPSSASDVGSSAASLRLTVFPLLALHYLEMENPADLFRFGFSSSLSLCLAFCLTTCFLCGSNRH